MIGKKRNKFILSGNHKYKETDRIHSVHLSLKSHLLWVTMLIIFQKLGNIAKLLLTLSIRMSLSLRLKHMG